MTFAPVTTPEFSYVGSELELFQDAVNWKRYYGDMLSPFLSLDVLEVGAGIGGTTQTLCTGNHDSWVCLEPDPALCQQIVSRVRQGDLPGCCEALNASLGETPLHRAPGTILYMDVLEHILADRQELELAAALLQPEGYIVVLAPAHSWLYSAFDEAVGHHRRYNKSALRDLTPPGTEVVLARYLDSCGICLSLANRVLARQRTPRKSAISFWDKCVVPLSRVLDPLFGFRVGKSVLMIWQKQADHTPGTLNS